MNLSVIIPVYNEEKALPALLASLEQLRGRAEILFADGGSTDRTAEMIPAWCRSLQSGKGRAKQMNAGAAASGGDVLLFLHADSQLPPHALDEIGAVMASHRAGCFGIAFRSRNIWIKNCQLMSNLRVKLRGIAFGDQGIFIRRELFFGMGGFPDLPIMEDYQFSLDLRARGERFGMTRSPIVTSDRRFLQGGPLPVMARMWRLRAMYRKGVDVDTIAALYQDIR